MKNVLFYRGFIGLVVFPSACSKTIRQLSRNVHTCARPIIWLQIKRIVIFVAPKQNVRRTTIRPIRDISNSFSGQTLIFENKRDDDECAQ